MKMESHSNQNIQGLNWAIGLNRAGLNLFGVWPGNNLEHSSLFKKYLSVPLILIVTTIALLLPQMYALCLVIKELPLVVDNLLTSVATLTNSMKLWIFWRKQRGLATVVTSLSADWLSHRDDWERQIMWRMAGRGRFFTIFGCTIMIGCLLGFSTFPLLGISYRVVSNITDYGKHRLLPVQSFYPYNYSISPYYELTYLSQIYPCYVVCMSLTILDNFFGVLIFHTCGQLEIVGLRLRNLSHDEADTKTGRETFEKSENFRCKLGKLVDAHVQQIKMVEIIEESYNLIILSECIAMSIFTCCLGFMISNALENNTVDNMQPIIQVLFLSGSLICVLIHVYAFCVAGETLSFCSEDIVHHVYFSKWYTLRRKNIVDMFPILHRSKHPLRVTAGKFMFLSLETFGKIFKTSAGYFSMLIAVKNK